jgi:predicted alpha/beta-hydrolase family hydrolase
VGGTATTPAVSLPTPTPVVPSQAVSFPSQDGVVLGGVLYGEGTQGNDQGNAAQARAIILSDEGDNDASKWQPIAQVLARRGYLVLSYSYRRDFSPDHSSSEALRDLRGAMAFMQTRHPSALALIGSSLGGLASLAAAATSERVDAVVAISAPVQWEDVQLSDGQLAGLRAPKLFVISEDNQPFTDDTMHMYAMSPPPKQLREYPGRVHGIGLFDGASGADLWSALLAFLQAYLADH